MRVIGVVLVLLALGALVFGGIGYNRNRTVFEMGDMHATVTEHKNIPIAPIVGVLSLVAGVALIVVGKRRGA